MPEEARSTGPSASLTEGHAGKFLLETFPLLRVAGAREAVDAFEEALFSCSRTSSPDSTRSAMTRLVLVLLVRASDFTRRATRAGRLTL